MFGFGKRKKIEKLVVAIDELLVGQTLIMPISFGELITLSQADKLIAGYLFGFQLKIISHSPFPKKDHEGVLVESYYNLFGSPAAQGAIDFAYNNLDDDVFNSGFTTGMHDISSFANDSKTSPLGLLRILYDRQETSENTVTNKLY